MFAGKKSAQIREILISESTWEEMTCLFAPSLAPPLAEGSMVGRYRFEFILIILILCALIAARFYLS